jgi:hypothetical protein
MARRVFFSSKYEDGAHDKMGDWIKNAAKAAGT